MANRPQIPPFRPVRYYVPPAPPQPVTNYGYAAGAPPSYIRDGQVAGKLIQEEKDMWRDDEIIIPLNHWERRFTLPISGATTFSTPLFDFWYDHLVEEGLPSSSVVSSAGGGMAFGGASGPGPGTSPQDALRWQNNVFDYTLKVVTSITTVTAATVTLKGGMDLQTTDEPVTISTMTVTNDLSKSDQTVFISGRVPMRFLRFDWSLNLTAASYDIIQQIGVRAV